MMIAYPIAMVIGSVGSLADFRCAPNPPTAYNLDQLAAINKTGLAATLSGATVHTSITPVSA